ncbi:MAG: hypothetical protein AAF738_05040 [Bacteroidota bacterium]
MASIWQQIKGLFQSVEQSSPTQPVLHSLIARSEDEQKDYDFWKDTLVCTRLMNWVHDQYTIYLTDAEAVGEGLDFLSTPSSSGFMLYFYKTQYSRRDAVHFFDHLKKSIQQQLNYRSQISDVRTYNRANWVETTQRHYLKPRIHFEADAPFDQQFGNILIELVLRNEQPHQLKFQTTAYHDMKFKKVNTFKNLMELLLS